MESQKRRLFGGTSAGRGERERGGKVQGLSSTNGRYRIDRGRLRMVQEMEKPKNL